MIYIDCVNEYLACLTEKKHTRLSMRRERSILTNWFTYSLSLLHPDVPDLIKKVSTPVFFNNQKLFTNTDTRRIKLVEHFLNIFKSDNKIIYLNMKSFLMEYQKNYLYSDPAAKLKMDDLNCFLTAAVFSLPVKSLNKQICNDCISFLKDLKIDRADGIITRFLIFCYDKKCISFNPNRVNKKAYTRCLEDDFIGNNSGKWGGYLKKYILYLQNEKNYSNGGIDYRIRKLKIFTKYLDEKQIKKPELSTIKEFLTIKEQLGIKKKTLSYYLYEIKYFLCFLNKKGLFDNNPALDFKIKYEDDVKKEVLSEQEVYKILQYFDDGIYRAKNPINIQCMKDYFGFIRDRLIFQIFVFLGLRLSELANIKTNKIDFTNKSIEITGKGNRNVKQKICEIKLDSYIWKSLNEYLKIRSYPNQEYFFISWPGNNLSISGINRIIHARIKEAGINKKISPHRLRATCASLYIKKGVDPLTLKTIMRHNSISTTIDKYAQLTEEELRKVWKQTNPLKGVSDEE